MSIREEIKGNVISIMVAGSENRRDLVEGFTTGLANLFADRLDSLALEPAHAVCRDGKAEPCDSCLFRMMFRNKVQPAIDELRGGQDGA